MEPLSTRPTAQELAFHTAWMRRLARALVHDASTAEDVVQDAWAKLEPRRAPLGVGYLAAVVRSLAWSRHRSDTRRNRREAASARPEALPSAAEVSARVEIARRVAEALQELPEPYRTTLVLRYYDDLSAAEIARREGIPAATVRSRQKRGLESLRERLDERPGGRAGWMAALVPFTRSELGAPGALVASVTTLIAMKLVLASLSVAVALAFTWQFVARSGNNEGASAALAPEPHAAADTDAARPERSDVADALRTSVPEVPEGASRGLPSTAAAVPETFRLRARAVDGDGRPIAGAWLGSPLWTERSAPSSADGRLEFEIPSAEMERFVSLQPGRTVVLEVGAPLRRTRSPFATVAQDDDALDLGDVRLEPGGTLLGRVVNESGLGLEGAELVFGKPTDIGRDVEHGARSGPSELHNPMTRLDDEQPVHGWSGPGGAFRLDGVPAGHGTLWARTDRSRWAWNEPIGLRAGEEVAGVEIVVRESPELVITGRVVDPLGKPVPGVEILASDSVEVSAGWAVGRTDARGRFHFVPRNAIVRSLHVEPPEWEWDAIVRTDVAAGTLDLELAFAPSRWLQVEVRATDGKPLGNGRVQGLPAEGPTEHALPRNESTLDAEGRARLRRGEAALRVRVESAGYRSVLLSPFEPAAFPDPLAVTLEALPALVGRVLRPDGRPAAGARVSLHRGAPTDDAKGRTLHLSHQGWSGDGEPFVYALHVEPIATATADAQGHYRLPLPGVDASAAGEVARPPDAFAGFGYVSRGTQLATAKAGQSWYVHAALSGESTLSSGPHVFDAPEEVELELRLPLGGSIAGRLELEGGRSPAGWTMAASDGLAQIAVASVSGEGTFRLDDLHPGGWQLSAYEPGQRPWSGGGKVRTERLPEPEVAVEAGRTTEYVHVSRPKELARLRGRLWIDGAPPGAWRVVVRVATRPGVFHSDETSLDPDGRFEVRLQPGLTTWLELVGSHAGTQLSIQAKPAIGVGDNDWSCDLESARLEGRISPERTSASRFGSTHYRVERGDVQVRSEIAVDVEGRFGPIAVAAGRGVLRGPQGSMHEAAPVWAELDLAPGETRALDLR